MATPTNLPATAVSGEILTAAYVNNLRGAFRVLQVVNGSYATQTATSSSAYSDTGLTATITPQSATSQILVLVNQAGCLKEINNTRMQLKLVRGATDIITFEMYGGFTADAGTVAFGSCSTSYLDSPATTSATTYKTQFMSQGNNQQVIVQTGGGRSTITLMEISA
jgi:hypothetical protein